MAGVSSFTVQIRTRSAARRWSFRPVAMRSVSWVGSPRTWFSPYGRPFQLQAGTIAMRHQFTLEYWRDGDWYVGRLVEVPGVFSQGKTLTELNENIQDAYELMVTQERPPAPATAQRRPMELEI